MCGGGVGGDSDTGAVVAGGVRSDVGGGDLGGGDAC